MEGSPKSPSNGGREILVTVAKYTVQAVVVLAITFITSLLFSRLLFYLLVPQPAVVEKLHFDFRESNPKAVLRLGSSQSQWDYIRTTNGKAATRPHVLVGGAAYDFTARTAFSKSPRNIDLGKVVLTTTVVDSCGDATAQSVRLLPLPYRTTLVLVIEDLIDFWRRLLGFRQPFSFLQQTSVMSLLDNFVEPRQGKCFTSSVHLELSTSDVDIEAVWLDIAPQMSTIISLMSNYSTWYYLITVPLFTVLQMSAVGAAVLVWYLLTTEPAELRDTDISPQPLHDPSRQFDSSVLLPVGTDYLFGETQRDSEAVTLRRRRGINQEEPSSVAADIQRRRAILEENNASPSQTD